MNLKSLCKPVLALMRRLSYGHLFSLVGVVLLTPLVYLLYLQVSATSHDVEFNQKESYGVENTETARQLLQEVSLRRLQTAARERSSLRLQDDMSAAKSRMREIASRLEATSKRLGTALADANGEQKTVARAKDVINAWQAMDQNSAEFAANPDAGLQGLVAMLNDFILNYVGNYSNLILDPDLDSYWLMDAYTGRLASLSETIVNIGTLVTAKSTDGQLADAERLTLAALVERAKVMAGELRTNFETAFQNNANGNLRPALSGTVADTLTEVETFLGLIGRESLGTVASTLKIDDVFERSAKLVETIHGLYQKVGPQLDDLIMARVHNHSSARTTGLITGGLAVLLLIYVLLAFYFQVASELTSKINEAEGLRNRAEAETQLLNSNIMDMLTFVANCADGDLTGRANVTEGALGNVADAMNQMMDNWTRVLSALISTIEETTDAGKKIGMTAESMAAGATQQVQKLDGATGAVQQIRGDITHVSENAATAATAASRTQESAFNGSEMVQKIAEEMETLRANVQAGAKKIKNLGDRSMEITGIVGTIAKISEQTNMLALNAAIEAARAGEHGRGFSVVAEEVRKLAERTSMATQDIRGLITSIQAETSESVAAIEEQTRAVEHHSESVTKSGQVLSKIQHESTQTSELIADMNRIAKGQVPVAEQTLQSMLSVSEIARNTQSSAQQTLQLSHVLGDTAERLTEAISTFKITR